MPDIFENHYLAVRDVILSGLMHGELLEAIKKSSIPVIKDALERSNVIFQKDEDLCDTSALMLIEADSIGLKASGFEHIMNAVGNGRLKTGIMSLINDANDVGWTYGKTFKEKHKDIPNKPHKAKPNKAKP